MSLPPGGDRRLNVLRRNAFLLYLIACSLFVAYLIDRVLVEHASRGDVAPRSASPGATIAVRLHSPDNGAGDASPSAPEPIAAEPLASEAGGAVAAEAGEETSVAPPMRLDPSRWDTTLSATAGDDSLNPDFRRSLLRHLERFRRYPEAARRAGMEGVVKVSLSFHRDGRILQVYVAETSGAAMLDAAALDTIRRAAPLPRLPAGSGERETILVPVSFSLSGG